MAQISSPEQSFTYHMMNVTQTFLAIGHPSAGIYSCEGLLGLSIPSAVLSGQWTFSLSVRPAMLVNVNFEIEVFTVSKLDILARYNGFQIANKEWNTLA